MIDAGIRGKRGTPGRDRTALQPSRVLEQPQVRRVSAVEAKVDRHVPLRRSGPAADQAQVGPRQRVLEVVRAHLQLETGAGDRHPALQLVEGDADPGVIEPRQRALDAFAANSGLDVPQLDAGVAEQREVRAVRLGVDPVPQGCQQLRLAPPEGRADDSAGAGQVQRLAEPGAQPPSVGDMRGDPADVGGDGSRCGRHEGDPSERHTLRECRKQGTMRCDARWRRCDSRAR